MGQAGIQVFLALDFTSLRKQPTFRDPTTGFRAK